MEFKAVVTVKSKDYLLGYIDSMIIMKSSIGAARIDLHGDQIEAKEKNEILGDAYLDLTCPCGFYIAYKTSDEIPEESIMCPLCEEVYLIKYLEKINAT